MCKILLNRSDGKSTVNLFDISKESVYWFPHPYSITHDLSAIYDESIYTKALIAFRKSVSLQQNLM